MTKSKKIPETVRDRKQTGRISEGNYKPKDAIEVAESDEVSYLVKTRKGSYRNLINDDQHPDGLYLFEPSKDDPGKIKTTWVTMNPITVLNGFSSTDNTGHGITIKFPSQNGRMVVYEVMKKKLTTGNELLSELSDFGMVINIPAYASNAPLIDFLRAVNPDHWITHTNKTGWVELGNEKGFVTPSETIGIEKAIIQYRAKGEKDNLEYMYSKGTLENWQKFISIPLGEASSRVALAISAAFYSSLLGICGLSSIGIHFVGASSKGKTTAIRVARSTMGASEKLISWKNPPGGMELLAVNHNDLLLTMDEISAAGPALKKNVPDLIYCLIEGLGARRMNPNGTARKVNTWLLVLLSSGEESIGDIVKQYKLPSLAGREVRLIQIPAEAGASIGIYEKQPIKPDARPIDLKGRNASNEIREYLTEQLRSNFGTALPAFLKCLVLSFNKDGGKFIRDFVNEKTKEFTDFVLKDGKYSTQVQRVAGSMGGIYAAGLLASGEAKDFVNAELLKELGYENVSSITGWTKHNLLREAMKKCFDDWLKTFGSGNDKELDITKDRIAHFLANNRNHFLLAKGDNSGFISGDFKGWVEYEEKETLLYMESAIFEEYIAANNDMKKQLATLGILETYSNGGYQKRVDLPIPRNPDENKRFWVYVIHWRDGAPDESETDSEINENETCTKRNLQELGDVTA